MENKFDDVIDKKDTFDYAQYSTVMIDNFFKTLIRYTFFSYIYDKEDIQKLVGLIEEKQLTNEKTVSFIYNNFSNMSYLKDTFDSVKKFDITYLTSLFSNSVILINNLMYFMGNKEIFDRVVQKEFGYFYERLTAYNYATKKLVNKEFVNIREYMNEYKTFNPAYTALISRVLEERIKSKEDLSDKLSEFIYTANIDIDVNLISDINFELSTSDAFKQYSDMLKTEVYKEYELIKNMLFENETFFKDFGNTYGWLFSFANDYINIYDIDRIVKFKDENKKYYIKMVSDYIYEYLPKFIDITDSNAKDILVNLDGFDVNVSESMIYANRILVLVFDTLYRGNLMSAKEYDYLKDSVTRYFTDFVK